MIEQSSAPESRPTNSLRRKYHLRNRILSVAMAGGIGFASSLLTQSDSPPVLTHAPTVLEEGHRLPGVSVQLSVKEDGFKSLHTNREGEPVRWDPCRPIYYVLNNTKAPAGGMEAFGGALGEVSAHARLRIQDVGRTDEVVDRDRSLMDERYGGGWAPVLIDWTTPAESDGLLESPMPGVAALGYTIVKEDKTWFSSRDNYVSGEIALNAPAISAVLQQEGGQAKAQKIIAHELGHLVGLDHVNDPSSLMNPWDDTTMGVGSRGIKLSSGDMRGLRAMGEGPCQTEPNTSVMGFVHSVADAF